MPWSGGTFSRVHDWTTDAGGGIDIEASRMDAEDDGFATGINTCLTKDGQNEPTANLPMGGFKHTNVANAAAKTEYTSAADVMDQHLIYYVTTGSANAYVLTPSPSLGAYAEGQRLVFRANHSNSGAATLNVNSLGATAIEYPDGSALASGAILIGEYYEVTYDANGTRFVLTSCPSEIPASMLPATVADVAGLATTNGGFIVGDGSNFVLESGATARTSLGLGSIATQASSSVSITGGSITGITDLAVADGGTGSSTASGARTALGLAIGSDVQAFDAALTDLANVGVVSAADRFLVSTGVGAWGYEAPATVRATLNLEVGTDVQAWDAHLDDIAAVAAPTGADQFLVSTGAGAYALESGATVRGSLGLGSIATQNSNSVSITGGSISGITDLAVADGGTGSSTASGARTALGLAIGTNVQAYDAGLSDIAGLAVTNGNFIVGDGANWVAESGATARTSLGLGTGDSPTFNGATLGSAVLTGPSADRLEVGGRVAFIHDNTSYTSAEIFFSTSAPTTEGNNGDIYFEYTA